LQILSTRNLLTLLSTRHGYPTLETLQLFRDLAVKASSSQIYCF
jgi:hypothetical protein